MAAQELEMNFVGGWMLDQHYLGWDPKRQGDMPDIADPGHGVINFGSQSAEDFMAHVGLSKAMIINWNRDDPWNKSHWHTQHPSLNQFEPPYVYHVHARDWDSFLKTVAIASATEIPKFIPQHMTELAVQERLIKLMETDWRALAASLLEERLQDVANGKQAYYGVKFRKWALSRSHGTVVIHYPFLAVLT
ncbi:hypothetical protein CVT25_005186 [Psilocybe cyanescens]|uniref:Uncharacterized protein n=1 Tax=Psilocybe cyanescens TaxID=93625 RepID=A0A409XBV3_PSICY|nr:hypothetical protein CVT25_005186 [Psilocybe cyanescens]